MDAATLEMTLSEPDPAMLNYLTQDAGLMESPEALRCRRREDQAGRLGPYVLDTAKTVVGSKYAYTKNPTYFAKDQQYCANLVIKVFGTTGRPR